MEINYFGILFMCDSEMECEKDRQWTGEASTVKRAPQRSVVVKREPSWKAKPLIYQSFYVPTLTCTWHHGCKQLNWVSSVGRLVADPGVPPRPKPEWVDEYGQMEISSWERSSQILKIISQCKKKKYNFTSQSKFYLEIPSINIESNWGQNISASFQKVTLRVNSHLM